MCALLQFLLRGKIFLLLERIKNIDSILQYNVYKINYIQEGKSNQSQLQYKKKHLPIIWKTSLLRRICAFIRAGQPVLFGYLLGFWEEIKNASWKDQTLTGLDDCESPTIPQSSKSVKIRSSSWTIFDSPKIHSCKYHWEKVQPREPFLHWMPSMVPQGYLKDENQRYVFFLQKPRIDFLLQRREMGLL